MAASARSVGERLAAIVAADPAGPMITWYDDATGDRAELSGATLANWVAKTANLLVDGCGLGPGDRAAVLLPPHWQSAAVLLGCWSVGLTVVRPEVVRPGEAGAEVTGPEPAAPEVTGPAAADVLFAAADLAARAEGWPAGDRYALALAPLAAPLRTVPPGFADYVVEVRAFADHFTAYAQGDELVRRALERAAGLGIGGDDRVLVDAAVHSDPIDWLLAPVLSGASVVLCGHLDRERLAGRVATERVTRVL